MRSGARSSAMPRCARHAHRRKRQHRALAVLTTRERDVFERIVAGKLNKQIADELGVSLRTVKAYRAHLMEKLGVETAGRARPARRRAPRPARLSGRHRPLVSARLAGVSILPFGAATLHQVPISGLHPVTIRRKSARSVRESSRAIRQHGDARWRWARKERYSWSRTTTACEKLSKVCSKPPASNRMLCIGRSAAGRRGQRRWRVHRQRSQAARDVGLRAAG